VLKKVHFLAGIVGTATIALFFSSTLVVEIFGTHDTVARLKSLIVMPGLLILVPAMAAVGGSGFTLARGRRGKLTDGKRRRMPIIGTNGLLVLVPCALALNAWAAAGRFDRAFYIVQVLELAAGAVNLWLMSRNMRDGLLMTGRIKPPRQAHAG
jgi:hypothetical protein